MKKRLLLVLIAVTILLTGAAHAADKTEYLPATLDNVSSLLFKKKILKTDDPAAMEEYIRIHNCGLYEQYGRDEFAWNRIRDAMGRDLELRLQDIPDGLEIANEISVDDYDLGSGTFPISNLTKMTNVGQIALIAQSSGQYFPCKSNEKNYQPFVPRMHPLNLTLRLDTPVDMTSFPVNRKLADALVNDMANRKDTNNPRTVLVVMDVRMNGLDPMSVSQNPSNRTALGQIDDLRIYEGPRRQMLLYHKDYAARRAKDGSN
ncbi:MAG: DUF4852 domain-containing protein [Alphaproteobacteria bacterium]|nr:DUF4852 domain-containing protein [Alphaproteobacteria bacterium]USO07651.1 MAG: DUF4852 domain-containing protein [Rhodospirillales bacterium]